MKKLLSVIIAVCLVLTMSIASFAASVDVSKINADVTTIVTNLGENPTDAAVTAAAKEIITKMQAQGAVSDTEILDAADTLYRSNAIPQEVYDAIYVVVANHEYSTTKVDQSSAIDVIKDIIGDDNKSTEEKATAIAELLSGFSSTQIETILDKLYEDGIIDDDMYNKISDAINSIEGGSSDVTLPSVSTDGIKDFFTGILDKLGLGGGSGDGDSAGTTQSTTKGNGSSFEGGTAKTGDYAVVSVAGVALVAGLALVITKKKK